MKKIIVTEWRRAWRWLSVQVAALSVAFGLLPADTQAAMLSAVGIKPTWIPAIIGALFIAGRLVNQNGSEK